MLEELSPIGIFAAVDETEEGRLRKDLAHARAAITRLTRELATAKTAEMMRQTATNAAISSLRIEVDLAHRQEAVSRQIVATLTREATSARADAQEYAQKWNRELSRRKTLRALRVEKLEEKLADTEHLLRDAEVRRKEAVEQRDALTNQLTSVHTELRALRERPALGHTTRRQMRAVAETLRELANFDDLEQVVPTAPLTGLVHELASGIEGAMAGGRPVEKEPEVTTPARPFSDLEID